MTKPILTNPIKNYYQKQVKLLLEILPEIDNYPCFALKGGTAINLFLRDFPRLSVDIDLTYLPLEPRGTFLNNLTNTLETLAQAIEKKNQNYRVMREYTKSENQLYRLRVTKDYVTIKIEPNLVLRGSVYPSKKLSICSTAQERFFTTLNINCLSFADIYAGKLCAALDRLRIRIKPDVNASPSTLFKESVCPQKISARQS